MREPQLVETAASLVPLLCPCAPEEQELGLKGVKARGDIGPARPAAHRSRSACCADVAQRQRRPARVKEGTSCRRSTRCAPGVRGAETDRCRSSDAPACWILCNATLVFTADREDVPGVRAQGGWDRAGNGALHSGSAALARRARKKISEIWSQIP